MLAIAVLIGVGMAYRWLEKLPADQQTPGPVQEEQTSQSDFSEQFEPDEWERQLMSILPECQMPAKTLPPTIPAISNHVAHCTAEPKEAVIIETGLPCVDEFRYDEQSDQLLSVNWCDYTAQNILDHEGLLETFQCRGMDNGQLFFAQKFEDRGLFSYLPPQALALIKQVLKAGLTEYIVLDDLVGAYTAPRP